MYRPVQQYYLKYVLVPVLEYTHLINISYYIPSYFKMMPSMAMEKEIT